MKDIIKFYKKNKSIIISALVFFVIASLALQLYLFNKENLKYDDVFFQNLSWSESCDGKDYTLEDKELFCAECLESGGEKCVWPLDITIIIDRVSNIIKTGGEVHCYLIINDVNYYYEKGKFYGVIEKKLFTWEVLDSTKSYKVEVCCAIERENPVATLVGMKKKWPQACVQMEVEPRCVQK